jgi:5'-nucleotidase
VILTAKQRAVNEKMELRPGLWAVVRSLRTLGRVLVVAPNGNYSGYGPALPRARELSFQHYRHDSADLRNVTAYALHAPPATCVQVGLSGAFSKHPIDFGVSCINDALNLGQDVARVSCGATSSAGF